MGSRLDPLYVDTAIRRGQNLTGRDAVRVSAGKLFRDIEAEKEQGGIIAPTRKIEFNVQSFVLTIRSQRAACS